MSPKSDNGLCADCNLGQEIIMNKVADFEPVNEDRWSEELEDFRYKLDRMHPLCPRCTIQVHGKLEEDKKKFSSLIEMKYKLKHAIGSTLKNVMSNDKKSRKNFFAGGNTCETLHFVCLFMSLLLFLSNIDYLQQDAGTSLITFPKTIQDHLPTIYLNSLPINAIIFLVHLIAIFSNKCRVTLPDLLFPVLSIIYGFTFLVPSDNISQDMALVRCACSSFIACLSMAVTFLPRKRLHKKKPNKMVSSAFSLASTPTSQCSSQNSRNASLLEYEKSIHERTRLSPHSPSGSPSYINSSSPSARRDIPNRSIWSERTRENNESMIESMDWDDSESMAQSTRTAQSHFRPGILSRNLNDRMTPQQLTPSVASLNLDGGARQSESTPSIFSRQHRRMTQQQPQNMTPARSLFGPARSMVTSNVERNQYMPPEIHTRPGSVFTSVSQQETMVSGAWQCRVIGILFALVFIVLIMQIGLFYVLFTRN
uniref:Ima1_N domain-containing protein n=1 Tax=Caenorhabditis tropicalis TaxID=1561998 RepID=A0A1I7T0N9_9PELO